MTPASAQPRRLGPVLLQNVRSSNKNKKIIQNNCRSSTIPNTCWEIKKQNKRSTLSQDPHATHMHKFSRVPSTVTSCGKCISALTFAEFLVGAMTQMLHKRSRGNKRVCHHRMHITCLHKKRRDAWAQPQKFYMRTSLHALFARRLEGTRHLHLGSKLQVRVAAMPPAPLVGAAAGADRRAEV